MSKKTVVYVSILAAIVLVAVVALAVPQFYRDVIVGPAVPEPTLAAAAAADGVHAGDPVAADSVEGAWHVVSGSFAGYRVHEVLNGSATTVVGRTHTVSGDVTVHDGAVSAASITVDVASIVTGTGARDSYFHNTAMKAFTYPTATFTLRSPVSAASTPRTTVVQTVTASGDLTLAGVTRPVTAQLEVMFDGVRAQVAGSIPITFKDFGITAPSLGFVKVEDHGSVEFLVKLGR